MGHRSCWPSIAGPSGPAASLPECQSTDLMKANGIINHMHRQHSSSWDLSKHDSCSEGERGTKPTMMTRRRTRSVAKRSSQSKKGDISKKMGWEPLWARQKAVSPRCPVVKHLQTFVFLFLPLAYTFFKLRLRAFPHFIFPWIYSFFCSFSFYQWLCCLVLFQVVHGILGLLGLTNSARRLW